LKEIQEFIRNAIGYQLADKIEIKESKDGFYSRWIKPNGKFHYELYVPANRSKLTRFTKLTLLHEVAHVIFNELFYSNHTKLVRVMDKILQHRMIYFLQGIWYWNPLLRKIKKKLGFSTTINYDRDDLYDIEISKMYTRRCNEYFCDYFALFVKKNSNFLLDM